MLNVVRVLERAACCVAAVALVAMIVVAVANALGRTWLDAPIYAANEVSSQWFLPLVVLLAIPSAQVWKEHYAVSLVTERLGRRSQALLACVGYVAGAVMCLAIAWFGLQEAVDKTGVRATAGITSLPIYLAYFLVPVGLAFVAVVFVCDAVLALRRQQGELNTGTGQPLHDDVETSAF